MNNLYTIIKALVTEKSSRLQEGGQYTFQIRRDASKIEVKHALKSIYGVDAQDVRVIISPKKIRLIGKSKVFTKRSVTKKAIVRLKKGQTLDPNKFNETTKKE